MVDIVAYTDKIFNSNDCMNRIFSFLLVKESSMIVRSLSKKTASQAKKVAILSGDTMKIELTSQNFTKVVEKLAQNRGVYTKVALHVDRVYMEIDESEKKRMDSIFCHPYLIFESMVFKDSFFDEHN